MSQSWVSRFYLALVQLSLARTQQQALRRRSELLKDWLMEAKDLRMISSHGKAMWLVQSNTWHDTYSAENCELFLLVIHQLESRPEWNNSQMIHDDAPELCIELTNQIWMPPLHIAITAYQWTVAHGTILSNLASIPCLLLVDGDMIVLNQWTVTDIYFLCNPVRDSLNALCSLFLSTIAPRNLVWEMVPNTWCWLLQPGAEYW